MSAQRIVSLLASGTEILYALGLGDRVVGVSHECDYPPDIAEKPRLTRARIDDSATSHDIDVEVKTRLAAGQPLYEIDTGLLASLQPDLIVTQSHCEVCAVSLDDLRDAISANPALRDARIVTLNPTTLDGIAADIRSVGQAAGVADDTEIYLSWWRARIDGIRESTRKLPADRRPRTACIEWIEPIMLGGNWMPELIEIAGGRCALTASATRSEYINWDVVRAYDPEVVVVMPCGFGIERALAGAPALQRNAGWNDMSAVRNGRVHVVDGNAYFNRSGPRIVDSLELLAFLIHPDRVPRPDIPFKRLSSTVA